VGRRSLGRVLLAAWATGRCGLWQGAAAVDMHQLFSSWCKIGLCEINATVHWLHLVLLEACCFHGHGRCPIAGATLHNWTCSAYIMWLLKVFCTHALLMQDCLTTTPGELDRVSRSTD
jgi:hypothetical protein